MNLDHVLKDSGSGMNKLVRVNVYGLSAAIVNSFREQMSKRLDASVRPAITSVLTPLANRKALVAVDAVAAADSSPVSGNAVMPKRCPSVFGNEQCADAAVLPPRGVAYLSGQPDEGGLATSAVARSMSGLMRTMGHLKLTPKDVVQVKVFLRPVTSADDVLRELRKFFPGQLTPPVVFVEWLAAVPVEIEMIARYPLPNPVAGKSTEKYDPARPPAASKIMVHAVGQPGRAMTIDMIAVGSAK